MLNSYQIHYSNEFAEDLKEIIKEKEEIYESNRNQK